MYSAKADGIVTAVTVDGVQVGTVFGTSGRFYFLLDEQIAVDVPRGSYRSAQEASLACENQAKCFCMAEAWDDRRLMMLDT